ncbi:MAG: dihydroorotate dehydrogenase electron transfer subunit [Candidatus Omnitrophica bacterium]|nr:dihydroorotate dehydrogenase electron transfer subunit [Candidatus Omnitrophota bacterium]
MRKKRVETAVVIENRAIAENIFRMKLKCPWIAARTRPGQFLGIKVNDAGTDPLLRIPLGIHRAENGYVYLLYKTVGLATGMLKAKEKGDDLDVMGPLGNGFSVGKALTMGSRAILVAGGYGVSPLYSLAETLMNNKVKVTIFIGARDKLGIVCDKELKKLGAAVQITTDDGSCGLRGCVTDAVSKYLRRQKSESRKGIKVFACGPEPMLKAVAGLADELGIPAEVSLDEYMACGVGACRGCAVKTVNGVKLACTDGPVFDARDVIWE